MEDNSTIINQNLSNQSQKPHLNWLIFVLVLIFGIGVGVLGTMMFQKNNDKQTNLSSNLQNTTTTSSTLPTTSPISPTSDPTTDWKIYNDPLGKFSFKYPANYLLDNFGSFPILNKKITWKYSDISTLDCKGDCPIITKTVNTVIDGKSAKKFEGYIGEIGGNIAHRFVNYEFKIDDKYLLISLEAIPIKLTDEEYKKYYSPGKIVEINTQDLEVFDKILSTFKFLN